MKPVTIKRTNTLIQQLDDPTIHRWYRFVLSYPDHLVSLLINRFGIKPGQVVLDPFVGTGTTLVECKRRGIDAVGIDANPMATFASRVKTTWDIDLAEFDKQSQILIETVREPIRSIGRQYAYQTSFDDLMAPGRSIAEATHIGAGDENIRDLLPRNWISETPLQKCLLLKQAIDSLPQEYCVDLFRLALANVLVTASNLGFGPEVYVARQCDDADVYGLFVERVRQIRSDLAVTQRIETPGRTTVYAGDARNLLAFWQRPVDFVICSPPYPNEKDYTRITRLELVILE